MQGITNPAEPFFKDGGWGWDGTLWRKLPLLWGYSGQLMKRVQVQVDGDGDQLLSIGTPDTDEVWVVRSVGARNQTSDIARIDFFVWDGTAAFELYSGDPPAANAVIYWSGKVVLTNGDYIYVYLRSCLDDNNVSAAVLGYKMKIQE